MGEQEHMNNEIAAVIVLFNPDIDRLQENIDAVISQVQRLVLVDNNSKNISIVEELYKYKEDIQIIKNDNNMGLAKALNQGICMLSDKYDWVLTLDQDSVVPANMFKEYSNYLALEANALLAPIIHDRNEEGYPPSKNEVIEISQCITSGSLVNVAIWNLIGRFDETLFIDIVDFEYCYRIKQNNYKIYRVNSVILEHECGHIHDVVILGRKIRIYNHNSTRKYYFARNWIYVFFKHRTQISVRFIVKQYVVIVIKTIFFEKHKLEKIKSIVKGLIDGVFMSKKLCGGEGATSQS